ncbi:hypothetical protein BD324DRAFT_359702 [Kockovaella imperatae]|uniref:Uncharacterized protein n=1 Tax=Kockovaella imperatae TaxID=4999 RepID=A0A1Y1UK96_9TREE|nr:hypothetical protein BD324DRAFT_359702 [Kockovaella imperatae]ORX38473.1 hypothetical protein BD324DRAFT_359702 [Kockovaella imperatae]
MPGDIDLAEASQTANGGESEYRRLCHLLIETCGRHQTGAASNENRDRDVRLALTVIEQHATSHAQSSSGSVESVIKWTIPRLVHAAINLTRSGTSQHLAHEIVSCIGTVIDTSCYHGPDTEQTPDNSQLRVLWILIHIFRFVDDVIEGRAKLLFGYKLPSQPLTCIFLLQMVVQHRRPFSERLRKLAFKSISVLGEQIKNDIQAQSSYMSMISSAGLNDVGDIDPWIMPLIWPTSNNELWISNQELLIRSLDTARPDVRFTLWSALSGRLLDPQQADKTEWFAIIQLTTSIEGFLEPLEIREYLGSTRIQVWQDKLRLSDLPDSTRAILNHNLSALVTGERHVGSGKRKRPSSGDGSESQWLLDELPELIEDGERSIQSGPIEAVNKLAKKTSDTGVLARICALLPRMIANHKASRQDARPAYSSHLELWTILAARLSDFSPGWRLLCLLIEDAEPGEVVSWLLGSKSTQDSILTASVQGNCRAIRAEASRGTHF